MQGPRQEKEKGNGRERGKDYISTDAVSHPLSNPDTDLGEMADSSRHPALETHNPRPLASGTEGARQWLAKSQQGRRQGRARAHFAVALPPDLLAATVGACANGVQHLVVFHPGRHGPAHRRTPTDRAAAAELQPPTPKPPPSPTADCLSPQPRLTVAGPGLAAYWPKVRTLRLSNWLRGTQHPGHLGKPYP